MTVERGDIRRAAEILRRGGVIAYPTEGCYGVGCMPRNNRAVRRILAMKRRSWRQGLIMIGAHWRHVAVYVDRSDGRAIDTARATWPGPYTWLLPAAPGVSRWLRGAHDTIAVRVTAHPVAAALSRAVDCAIVSTSANRHGRSPAVSAAGVRRQLHDLPDLILEGALGGQAGPTAIRDARTGDVLRPAQSGRQAG